MLVTPKASYRVRLIAGRLTEKGANAADKRSREQARKKNHRIDQRTLKAAAFILLVTSLPADSWSAEQILQLYRLRWQVQTSILLQVNVSVRALSDQPDQETPLSPPGWGFFVIERMTGIIDAANKTNQHVIELYLYQDSGEPQRN